MRTVNSTNEVKFLSERGISKLNSGLLPEARMYLMDAFELDGKNPSINKAIEKLKRMEHRKNTEKQGTKAPKDAVLSTSSEGVATPITRDTSASSNVKKYGTDGSGPREGNKFTAEVALAKIQETSAIDDNVTSSRRKLKMQNIVVGDDSDAVSEVTNTVGKKEQVAVGVAKENENKMMVLHSNFPSVASETLRILRKEGGMVMVEIESSIFLIAAPTHASCDKIEEIKNGSGVEVSTDFSFAIGHVNTLYKILHENALPSSIKEEPRNLVMFHPSHLNVGLMEDIKFSNKIVRDSNINCLITRDGSPLREFFKKIESGLDGYNDPDLIGGKHYSAPLITNANQSGRTSVKDWNEAKAFGKKHNIPLAVRFKYDENEVSGNLGIFQIRSNAVHSLRRGDLHAEIGDREKVKQLRVGFATHVIDALDLISGKRSIASLYEMFKSIDTNDGFLDRNQFEAFLNKISKDATNAANGLFALLELWGGDSTTKRRKEQTDILFNAIDFQGDGILSFVEFVRFLEDSHERGATPQMRALQEKFVGSFVHQVNIKLGSDHKELDLDPFIRAFNMMDLNHDHSIKKHELQLFFDSKELRDDQEALSDIEIAVLFAFIDTDGSEEVSLIEMYSYLEDCVQMKKEFVERKKLTKESMLEKRGAILFEKNKFEESARTYREAAGYSGSGEDYVPDDIELCIRCLSNAALCHIKLSEWEDAIMICDVVLRFGETPKAMYCRGIAKMNLGRLAESHADLTAASNFDNDNEEVKQGLLTLKQIQALPENKIPTSIAGPARGNYDADNEEDKQRGLLCFCCTRHAP
mmetsp:Transcript_29632/g.45286  ORF Transcript_29632/g.45286 Transcript_29632/m.45286 type:complete len:811 (-) Transcript_29632:58-2490(-)|eukprot:CAMPEP_0194118278 /NCGR_PEP_ID=MMETSP0150-20130528/34686_1 /TAXON_ID=122233 /ORGANISM="Chaetoceros debilis, Strain MM31A-1" /LENGTH=810 /DNA_ID=CAMNT_0038809589 /DNA_START=189 /DNA_END=2621 /DNA_ORIENTATION=-